ncbi:3-oxo-tetronate kinase [Piscinibacter sakaiensis]|uniref:3-oxo-tetronate kinase n=1 Tax=Piscinibacter sakaiensis TaxID=1547922 RepID=UPI003AAAAFCA
MLLGCIADDFTGATDLANNLVRSGMRVVQTIGKPDDGSRIDADAVVVALKSRTIEPAAAVEQSLAALSWLRRSGAAQVYFKVCSTFDSTDRGNIGPVAEALLEALGGDFAPVCPAFPENQRTVFKGHLFVGDLLLSDSSMRNHPLTPMTDPNLVRVMQRQCRGKVGLVDQAVVAAGSAAIRNRMTQLRNCGHRFGIVDAISNVDLMSMGQAFSGMPLIVAGSGVAIGLPQNHGFQASAAAARLPAAGGLRAIVSGSCSAASNAQVADFLRRGGQAYAIDPLRIAAGEDTVSAALAWAAPRLVAGPILVYATSESEAVKAVQARLGVEQAGALVEQALSSIALGLVERGVRQLVVAGGETSGACVQALEVAQLRIGPQIDPGVPWCHADSPAADAEGLHLALKSGNFGTFDFFTKAFDRLA